MRFASMPTFYFKTWDSAIQMTMNSSMVIMGVAGCGKSSLGSVLALALHVPLVEGDDFHSAESRQKMSQGTALTDDDRTGWLDRLCAQLRQHPGGIVLTCSALKQSYRDRLRLASPDLRFAFLQIGRADAQVRVGLRGEAHFFSSDLVDSQFATLQVPTGEPGVLTLDAMAPLSQLQAETTAWLANQELK
jgi:gluconokinase